jgi:hypothetical protein
VSKHEESNASGKTTREAREKAPVRRKRGGGGCERDLLSNSSKDEGTGRR